METRRIKLKIVETLNFKLFKRNLRKIQLI